MRGAHDQNAVLAQVARKLAQDGYEVVIEPRRIQMPFDLGGYLPDLLARRADRGLLVEARSRNAKLSAERFREVLAQVRRQKGWRFVVIDGAPKRSDAGGSVAPLRNKEQLSRIVEAADRLAGDRLDAPAFILLWSAVEALLQERGATAGQNSGATSAAAAVSNAWSEGLLNMQQFLALQRLLDVRTSVLHGAESSSASN